jgi:hypothetical protein
MQLSLNPPVSGDGAPGPRLGVKIPASAGLLQYGILPEAMQDLGQTGEWQGSALRVARGAGARGAARQRGACAAFAVCQRSSFARAPLVAGSISCAWRAALAVSSIT